MHLTVILLLSAAIAFAVFVFIWHYLFSVYEVKFKISETCVAENSITYRIEPMPINSVGYEIIGKKVDVTYSVEEKNDNILFTENVKNMFFIKVKNPGEEVTVVASSFYLLADNKLTVQNGEVFYDK